jgi:HK97 family phage portal protein
VGAIADLVLGRGSKAAGVPSISDDGRFITVPTFGWLQNFGMGTQSGTHVSNETALGLPTLFSCVRVLAEDVASLPLILYRRLPGGGKARATDHELYPVFHDSPNPDMTTSNWLETLVTHMATWGNTFNEQVIDDAGRLQIWPLGPERFEVRWDGGKVFDRILPNGERKSYREDTIFHIPGLSLNGLVGVSPVALHRETVGASQATRDFGSNFYRNQARPAVILSTPKTLSPGAIERLAAQMDALRGARNAGKTVIMEEGLEAKEIGVPPEDAQYIETRKLQDLDICRLYRMPPHKVGILDHATFSNIEHQSIDYVTGTLRPWLVRIERAIKKQFLWNDPDLFVEFLIDGLLRGDSKARAEALDIQRRNGVINADDWNEIENRNPLPDGLGQTYWMPVNYQPALPPSEAEEVAEPAGPPRLSVVKMAQFDCPECGKLIARKAAPGTVGYCRGCKTEQEFAA